MKGKEKTKEQLMDELVKLHRQIAELEKLKIKHQQMEETLCECEEKYRILSEATTDCIFIETVEGRVLECNTAGARMFGYNKKDMIGLTIADRVSEEFAKKLPKVITEKEATQGFFMSRISKKKDGTIFPTKIVTIRGKPRLITYVRDITKRKEAEKKLRKARKMFASLFNSSPEATLYHDKEGRIININPRFTELFGYTLEEIKGRNINDGMIHLPDKITFSKGYFNYETIRKKKEGTLFPVLISGSNIVIDGQLKGGIGSCIDITERKKMEEKLKKLAHFDILTGCCRRGYGRPT